MRNIVDDFKIAAVLVGTMIGAGFATGREIALYYGDSSFLGALFGAFMCGLLCMVFLLLGKYNIKLIHPIAKNIMIVISAIIIFMAMYCASEELFFTATGINGGGLLTSILCCYISLKGLKAIKNINSLIILALVVLLLIIASTYKIENYTPKFPIFFSLLYAAMNILLTAELATIMGEGKSIASITRITTITSVLLMLLIGMIYVAIYDFRYFSMPLLESARALRLGYVATIVIYGAIITTMLSSVKLYYDILGKKASINSLTLSLLLCGFIASYFTFERIVNNLYYIISAAGMLFTSAALVRLVEFFITRKKLPLKKRYKLYIKE